MPSVANYTPATYQPTPAFAVRDRDALIETHLPQVRFIAERLSAKLPPWVDLNDLIGAGVLGLLDAVDKYDAARGVLFKTYAEMRVRGAILDSLRGLDWAPRSMRKRAREVEAAYLALEQKNGDATEEEVAAHLGLTLGQFHELLGQLRGLTITALDNDEESGEGQNHLEPADSSATPLESYERTEMSECLMQAIDRLSMRERQVVSLYYVEELTMKEIGAVLGVTESRVSQIHTQAVLRLRASFSALRSSMKSVS